MFDRGFSSPSDAQELFPHAHTHIHCFYCYRGAANEGKRQLVILHPFKVSIYSLHLTEGLAEHGMSMKNRTHAWLQNTHLISLFTPVFHYFFHPTFIYICLNNTPLAWFLLLLAISLQACSSN